MENKYKVCGWHDAEEFLTLVAKRMGKLLKGGEADIMTVAKLVIFHWQKGEIPYYYLPPGMVETDVGKDESEDEMDVEKDVILEKGSEDEKEEEK